MKTLQLDYNLNDFDVDTWFERDRSQITLNRKGETGEYYAIFTLWDNEVTEAIEDGFINPKHLLESCVQYAVMRGLL